jgi:hypothetical protein
MLIVRDSHKSAHHRLLPFGIDGDRRVVAFQSHGTRSGGTHPQPLEGLKGDGAILEPEYVLPRYMRLVRGGRSDRTYSDVGFGGQPNAGDHPTRFFLLQVRDFFRAYVKLRDYQSPDQLEERKKIKQQMEINPQSEDHTEQASLYLQVMLLASKVKRCARQCHFTEEPLAFPEKRTVQSYSGEMNKNADKQNHVIQETVRTFQNLLSGSNNRSRHALGRDRTF